MIEISETAAEKAKEILTAEGKQGWGLRVYMADSESCGSSYGMDIEETPNAGDEVIEKNGLKVFIDKVTSLSMSGKGIDFVDDGERSGFIITGDEAADGASSCNSGCGGCG